MHKKILYQSFINFAGTVLSVIIGFFFKIYITKYLGVTFLGTYSLGISLISIIMIFTSFGYTDGLIFFTPKYLSKKKYSRLHKYIQTTLIINTIVVLIFTSIILSSPNLISSRLLQANELEPYLSYFMILMILNSFVSILIQIINGFQNIQKSIMIEKFICNPIRIIIGVVLINLGFGFHGFLFAEIFSSVLAFLLLANIVNSSLNTINIPSLFSKSTKTINREEKSYSKNMFSRNIFNRFSSHFGKILIVQYLDLKTLGIYALLISITSFIPIVLNSINSVFKPIVAELYANNKIDIIKKYFQIISKYTFIFSLPIIGVLFLFINTILGYVDIYTYEAKSIFILLILAELMKCSKGPVYITLQMMGFDKDIRNIGVLNFFITITLIILLVPKYGLVGLGIAEILRVSILIILSSLILYVKSSIHIFNKAYFISLLISLLSFIVLYMVKSYHYDYLTMTNDILLGIIVFNFLLIPNLLLINTDEKKTIKALFY